MGFLYFNKVKKSCIMFLTENALRFVNIDHFCDGWNTDEENLKADEAEQKRDKEALEEQKKQIQDRDDDIKRRRRKQCARLFAGYDANIPGSEKTTAIFKITEIILNTTRTRTRTHKKKV